MKVFLSFAADNEPYDLVVIGLEEIVDLNASNMMKASTTNQRIWRDGIKKALESQYNGAESYVVLACEQLVGVCMIVYMRLELLGRMRDLAVSEVKTGLGGAAGNKGSIAVRLTVDSTSICCVCSHFAAGQNEIAARNEDFNSAMRRIRLHHVRLFAAFCERLLSFKGPHDRLARRRHLGRRFQLSHFNARRASEECSSQRRFCAPQ